ncbi:Ms4527A family Cys-rich leader peptide [Mycobacterium marinum]|uniref:Ms4527A family Cys-rich leader peptide n=1 Tax=Mycobacterium marinum TaxID=1781 RepID=UPI003B435200
MQVQPKRPSGAGQQGGQVDRCLANSHAKSSHAGRDPDAGVHAGGQRGAPQPREAGPSAAGPGCSQPLRGFVYPSPQSRSVVLVTVRQNQPCSRDDRGPWQNVTVPANSNPHIALVMRRHIDLKRVCSCCCLP